MRFVDEFHLGRDGLSSRECSWRERLREGVGGGYSREDTPLVLKSATLARVNVVFRVGLLAPDTGRLDRRFEDGRVVLLAKLLARDFPFTAYGVDVPWSLLWRLKNTTLDAGELPGVSNSVVPVLLATEP